MPTPRKEAMLADIQDRMSRASIAISADYRGLTVAQITELRRAMRPSGAEVKVVKNTLAAMAAKAAGRENMAEILQGPTALTIGYDDPRTALHPVRLAPGWYSFQIIRQPVKSSSAQLPQASRVPLGLKQTESTLSPSASKAKTSLAMARSQSLTVPSMLPEAR